MRFPLPGIDAHAVNSCNQQMAVVAATNFSESFGDNPQDRLTSGHFQLIQESLKFPKCHVPTACPSEGYSDKPRPARSALQPFAILLGCLPASEGLLCTLYLFLTVVS